MALARWQIERIFHYFLKIPFKPIILRSEPWNDRPYKRNISRAWISYNPLSHPDINRKIGEERNRNCRLSGLSCGLVIGTALKIIGTFRSPRKNYRNNASSYRNIISLPVETARPEEYESVKRMKPAQIINFSMMRFPWWFLSTSTAEKIKVCSGRAYLSCWNRSKGP